MMTVLRILPGNAAASLPPLFFILTTPRDWHANAGKPSCPDSPDSVTTRSTSAHEGAGRSGGGMEAMRIALARAAAKLRFAVGHFDLWCGLAAAALGVAVIAILQLIVSSLGADLGVRVGLLLGVWGGAVWGLSARRPTSRWVASADWIYLTVVMVLWPWWTAALLDLAARLPTTWWQTAGTATGVGAALGVAAAMVPAALICRLICGLSHPSMDAPTAARNEPGAQAFIRVLTIGGGLAAGILAHALWLAPTWGASQPVIAGLLVSTIVSAFMFRWSQPIDEKNRQSASAIAPRLALQSHSIKVAILLTAGAWGGAVGSISQSLAELWPVSVVLWSVAIALCVLGFSCGHAWTMWRGGSVTHLACGLALTIVGWIAGIPSLVETVLWQNSTLTAWWTWELTRAAILALICLPVGFVAACLSGAMVVLHDSPDSGPATRSSSAAAWWLLSWGGAATLGVLLVGGTAVTAWGASAGLAVSGGLALVAAALSLPAWKQTKRLRYVASGIATLAVALTVAVFLTGLQGHSLRASRLLFSTTAATAYRNGWERNLLEHLDDLRPVAQTGGRNGRWTVWQARGAEWQLRENGIPAGAVSAAAWFPQFAAEAMTAIWPLILVDHPARVLVLGAGSGATLRSCAAFPVREVVCHEADAGLIGLLRGPFAKATGFDPFAERCQWSPQPAEWLALPPGQQFEVIVSNPRSPVLPAGAACYTQEFYDRAARHLAHQGVFCQRFSSIDFGPKPLLSTTRALQAAFPEVACLAVGPGEYLLIAAHDASVLARNDLPLRLEQRAATALSALGWDWSFPLNLPAYDANALEEAAAELRAPRNTVAKSPLSFQTPFEMRRWAPKVQETAAVFAKPRTSAARFETSPETLPPKPLLSTSKPTRKGRYLEWIGPAAEHPEVLRRLAEVAGEQKLVKEYPDTYWWEYRKELRSQLQDHPRSAVIPVNFSGDSQQWHSEDRRRKEYFVALGALAQGSVSSADDDADAIRDSDRFAAVEQWLEPHDPLLTLFAHHELAEHYARRRDGSPAERTHRLYGIYFAPAHDVSVRNVVSAINCLSAPRDSSMTAVEQFDQLNGVVQMLRFRWEVRHQHPGKSAKAALIELERSLVAAERAVECLETIAPAAGISKSEWTYRRDVIERMLLRPFRTSRELLTARIRDSERRARQVLQQTDAE